MPEQLSGSALIANERQRQIEVEGWTAAHDDEHTQGELALAACCYASPERIYVRKGNLEHVAFIDPWPYDGHSDKRARLDGLLVPGRSLVLTKRIDLLVKAGALIAAEIDRLQRRKAKPRQVIRQEENPA